MIVGVAREMSLPSARSDVIRVATGDRVVRAPSLLARRWCAFKRNRGALIGAIFLLLIHLLALVGPSLTPYSFTSISLREALHGPSATHLLGTDELGRDVLTRLVYGARISLSIGLTAAVIATAFGTLLGILSGFFGGWIDTVLMRFTDSLLSIPTFFIALTVLAVFGNSIVNLITIISLTSWMGVARLARSECLRWKNREFVIAAQAIGASDARIMIRHITPQAISSILVAGTLAIAGAIAVESSLSYLGLGVQPPTPSLGNMLQKAQRYVWTRPELAVYPGVLISLTVLAYNFVGDGLRDALSPSQLGR